MALQGLPEGATVVGALEIVTYLKPDGGLATTYGMDGMDTDAAIGYLTVVCDRLREERRLQWDTCPGCGLPWSEHDDEELDPDE